LHTRHSVFFLQLKSEQQQQQQQQQPVLKLEMPENGPTISLYVCYAKYQMSFCFLGLPDMDFTNCSAKGK